MEESAAKVRQPLEEAKLTIDKAIANLAIAPRGNAAELQVSLLSAQSAIAEISAQQKQVTTQVALLVKLTEEIEKEKAAVQQAKSDIEFREKVYSHGFWVVLIGLVTTLAGLAYKLPMFRLDMQIKRLELREKELTVAEREAKGEAET